MTFPTFPCVLDDDETALIQLDADTKTVYMPLYLWLDIVDYVNLVNEQQRMYEKWQD